MALEKKILFIESKHNNLIKQITSLSSKKGREEQNAFIVEGERFVDEIPEDWNIIRYVLSERFADRAERYSSRAETVVVTDKIFERLTDTVTPQGLIAVCEKKFYDVEKTLDAENNFFIMAEGLSDPGNAGTIIRTAAAAGVGCIFFAKGCVDVYSPKVVRSAAGSLLKVPFVEGVEAMEIMQWMKVKGIILLAAHLKAKVFPYEIDLRQPCCILIGNEANGLTDKTAAMADTLVKLPMADGIESLNASVAGGILLYEVVRQRLFDTEIIK